MSNDFYFSFFISNQANNGCRVCLFSRLKINDAGAKSEQLMRCKILECLVKGKLQSEKVCEGGWCFSQLFALLLENFKGTLLFYRKPLESTVIENVKHTIAIYSYFSNTKCSFFSAKLLWSGVWKISKVGRQMYSILSLFLYLFYSHEFNYVHETHTFVWLAKVDE